MKKSIFFILPTLETGGAERITVTILNHLDLSKFEPVLVLFEKKGEYLSLLSEQIPIVELGVKRIRSSLFPLLNLLRKRQPQLVFCSYGEVNAFLSPFIPFFRKTKFIARETNVVSEYVKRKEILFFYRFYANFHEIIAQSEDMKVDLIQNFKISPDKITKIHNPIDFEFINGQLLEAESVKEYKKEQKNILAVGNLSYRKGFDLLLQVFVHLKEKPYHLFIMGEGPDQVAFLELKEKLKLDKVTFIGKKKNPFPYYQQADLFVLSSRFEGLPNALLEANACGTYAVSNDCPGGINEIIEENVNGNRFDISNSKAFALLIEQQLLFSHEAQKVISSVKERFDKEGILQKYYRIFEEV